MTKFGYVTLLGMPNAGKSTLLNQLMQEKISIVSRKAQTTRMNISGILTVDETQIVFMDTPGIFQPKGQLGKSMVRAAWKAVDSADIVVLVADASQNGVVNKIAHLIDALARRERKVIVALNKIDKVKRTSLLPIAQELMVAPCVSDIFMVSSTKDDGVQDLSQYLIQHMPGGKWLYDADQLSDISARILVAELTREQVFHFMHDEIPYGVIVVTDTWNLLENKSLYIAQTVFVTREQHRAIVLGNQGASLKNIGTAARQEIQNMLEQKVHLDLYVKVDPNWQEKPEYYNNLGLEF